MNPTGKDALQYLIEEAGKFDPAVVIDGVAYARDREGNLRLPPPEPKCTAVSLSTLSGMRDFLAANIDRLKADEHVLHVSQPHHVALLGPMRGRHKERDVIAVATADIPRFEFGKFHPAEAFTIALQSAFMALVNGDQRDELLAAVARLKSGTQVVQEDDGVSQSVTMTHQAGLVQVGALPNPVLLTPYRTFTEVAQVTSPFILRARGEDGGSTSLALFEADGGAWRAEARMHVHRHLDVLLGSLEETARPKLVV